MTDLELDRHWREFEKKFDAALTQNGMMAVREAMKQAFGAGFSAGRALGYAAATRRETPKDECTSPNS